MKITKQLLPGLLCSFFLCLNGCSTTKDAAEAYPGESPHQIFEKGEKALKKHSYQQAIKRFEALDVQYPFGHDTETAQLHIIYAYYMSSEYALAEASADRFIHSHPTNPHVDYAYYMRGLSNFYQNLGIFERFFSVDLATRDLTQIKKTFYSLSELEQRFPDSPYAPAAHQYRVYLRNLMASHELEVAQYYYRHHAFVAAANRANSVVRDFQGAPVVPDALVIMVKSYQALQLKEDAQEAYAVLAYNYPNSVYLKTLSLPN